jgi:tetratricopeptide (TPR) repeat protein
MSISGSLKTMHSGDLLQWCGTNLKTGTLRVKRGPIEKQLFFKGGRLFSSISNSPRETLGQFLIRSGQITEEQLFNALIQQDRNQEPLGQLLIKAGFLTEEDLKDLLRLKTEETIYDCFLWTDGEFIFEDDRLPEHIPISLPLDLTGVILEGARRTDEWERIRRVFPSRFTTFSVDDEAVSAADDLAEEDRRILDLARQGKNLAEIALEMHAVEFYAASRLLEYHQNGLVRVDEVQDEIPFEQQVEELRERLSEGVVCFNAGQYTQASHAFEAALDIDPQNKYARLFLLKIERLSEQGEPAPQIPLEKVPVLKRSLQELSRMTLDPQEGFVLSRVNGEWDIRSILKICPMSEPEVLLIFQRLHKEGLIELR